MQGAHKDRLRRVLGRLTVGEPHRHKGVDLLDVMVVQLPEGLPIAALGACHEIGHDHTRQTFTRCRRLATDRGHAALPCHGARS